MYVYLSGPIHGVPGREARGWRETAAHALARDGLVALDPMREPDPRPDKMMVVRDRLDIERASAMLVYLLDPSTSRLIGTCVEYGWADSAGVPIVTIADETSPDHPFLRELSTNVVSTLDEGVWWIQKLLLP